MFYSVAMLDLYRLIRNLTLARGNGVNFNTSDVTASAAGPTKSFTMAALI